MLSKPRESDGKKKLKRARQTASTRSIPITGFVLTIDKIPLAKGIPYHSIIADRGKRRQTRTRPSRRAATGHSAPTGAATSTAR